MFAVYVDLSAKIEQWSKDSVIAVSSHEGAWALLVRSRTKQQARRLIEHTYATQYKGAVQFRLLAILTYLAVKPRLWDIQQIIVDQDYSGRQAEARIKNLLLHLLRQDRPRLAADFVRFENVKGTEADILARTVHRGKARAGGVITFQEIAACIRGK